MENDWITTPEAAKISGYHPVHVRRLLSEGRVRGQKWGTQWQISRTSILEYVEQQVRQKEKRGPKPKASK